MFSKVIVLLCFYLACVSAYPRHRRDPRNSRVNPDTHPLLASVFSVANAVLDIGRESRMFHHQAMQTIPRVVANSARQVLPPLPQRYAKPMDLRRPYPADIQMQQGHVGIPMETIQPDVIRTASTNKQPQQPDLNDVISIPRDQPIDRIPSHDPNGDGTLAPHIFSLNLIQVET